MRFISLFFGKKIKRFVSSNILPTVFSQLSQNEISFVIHKKNLLLSLHTLKLHINYQYKILVCITGIDFLTSSFVSSFRFGVFYEVLSLKFNHRIRLKLYLNEMSTVYSSFSVFINSIWWEREVWDMFGIFFENHPDLRRILTDYGFDGFPLRKDFPLSGFIDLTYNSDTKRIVSKPLELAQKYRIFCYDQSWHKEKDLLSSASLA